MCVGKEVFFDIVKWLQYTGIVCDCTMRQVVGGGSSKAAAAWSVEVEVVVVGGG